MLHIRWQRHRCMADEAHTVLYLAIRGEAYGGGGEAYRHLVRFLITPSPPPPPTGKMFRGDALGVREPLNAAAAAAPAEEEDELVSYRSSVIHAVLPSTYDCHIRRVVSTYRQLRRRRRERSSRSTGIADDSSFITEFREAIYIYY